jgi:SAM-dependent methyltransferase
MDIRSYNREAWNRQVEEGNPWTVPVTSEQVQAAREGSWQVVLTPTIPVPRAWFPAEMRGADILCLASGGGQQGPLLAAAGARVTVFDNSPRQLARDAMVAQRDGLEIRTVEGDMADLSAFADASFDLIFHPVSNCFAEEILPVWRECYHVLRRGGGLLVGFIQPHRYCVEEEQEPYFVRWKLPFADIRDMAEEERVRRFGANAPLEFSHTFTEQIGGQLAAGFHLVDMFEDSDPENPVEKFFPGFMATRAIK